SPQRTVLAILAMMPESGARSPKVMSGPGRGKHRSSRPRASRSASLAITLLSLTACEPQYVLTDCLLPMLSTDVPTRTVINMGDAKDEMSVVCPVAMDRSFVA